MGINLKKTVGSAVFVSSLLLSSASFAATWTIQTSTVPGDPGMPVYQAWAEKVKVMTEGRVEINVVPQDAIVRYDELFNAVRMGVVQGQIASPAFWSGTEPAFGLMGDPVGAWSQALDFLDYVYNDDGLNLMRDLMKPYGQYVVGIQVPGVEAFVSTVPIHGVEDLKGLKIRSPEGMAFAAFEAVGAQPVQMSGNEIYSSLDKGVIDAADAAGFAANQAFGYHDIAKYPNFPGFHSTTQMVLAINQKAWDSVSKADQLIMETTFQNVAYEFESMIRGLDLKALAEVKKNPNVEVISWAPEENKKFRAICKKIWAGWAEKSPASKRVYDSLLNYLTERGLI
ncbi:TRAP transporter substrate-binding protein DctP [Polycladidibacter stylochi]|uniref:TRAP transporter substrate-binding protein DctP n=1 Tax=Polycladidibacter stylochi TaxID=1807766 RepID=UPI000830F98D|nr:TRAP transporter substrate-binding protein DctP [Pseudovibrio stylochi]